MRVFSVNVMSEANEIVPVCESHYTLAVNFWRGQDVLQDIADPITEPCIEIIEDQVWVSFAHGINFVFKIMSQHYVSEAEIRRRPVRHMTDDETVWLTSCLMYHYQVCEIVRLAYLDKFFQDI